MRSDAAQAVGCLTSSSFSGHSRPFFKQAVIYVTRSLIKRFCQNDYCRQQGMTEVNTKPFSLVHLIFLKLRQIFTVIHFQIMPTLMLRGSVEVYKHETTDTVGKM